MHKDSIDISEYMYNLVGNAYVQLKMAQRNNTKDIPANAICNLGMFWQLLSMLRRDVTSDVVSQVVETTHNCSFGCDSDQGDIPKEVKEQIRVFSEEVRQYFKNREQ